MPSCLLKKWIPYLILPVLLAVSGCAFLRGTAPRNAYLIKGESGQRTAADEAPPLRVQPLRIALPYSSQEFVYRTGENTFETDYYNLFFIPPEAMLTDATRNALYDGSFRPPSQSGDLSKTDYILEGFIIGLYADFRDEDQPKTILQIRYSLFKGRNTNPLFTKYYAESIPLPTHDQKGLVAAWTTGWNAIASRLRNDVKKHIP